jgi:hypothetical protein
LSCRGISGRRGRLPVLHGNGCRKPARFLSTASSAPHGRHPQIRCLNILRQSTDPGERRFVNSVGCRTDRVRRGGSVLRQAVLQASKRLVGGGPEAGVETEGTLRFFPAMIFVILHAAGLPPPDQWMA